MCGRYALYGPVSRVREQFAAELDQEVLDFKARYNAAPQQLLPVVRQRPTGERIVHLLRWGLIPSWSKDADIASKLINARSETVGQKPSFRAAYKSRRCLVPASGFYEWKPATGGGRKQPFFIHPADDTLFAFAGLWERWARPDGEALDTFTILTTDANDVMRELHDRMPVIVPPADYGLWLSKETPPELLHRLLAPCAPDQIRMHAVSPLVGNVRNEDADLVTPLT
ncbi:SOS response-associated peptidase [Aromatoleum toluolicum]|uniref:Abasic site processing protein n=1 Tax=Aromatoleum toluolicum TaxID=90060 RepID=A0ABX1NA47_9RHOO|nr:SOS response-associated peptidase [Aromatoleum toluolicum]NMF96171.1 SOS response-associated peptidase [Aromatoleum toluolicum]